jgi:hypothetical protein
VRLRRERPFADVARRQLDLFGAEHATLLGECDAALRAYDGAPAEDAEERYGAYVEATDAAREALEELRDSYAATLDPDAADAYAAVFAAAARKRFPALRLDAG